MLDLYQDGYTVIDMSLKGVLERVRDNKKRTLIVWTGEDRSVPIYHTGFITPNEISYYAALKSDMDLLEDDIDFFDDCTRICIEL